MKQRLRKSPSGKLETLASPTTILWALDGSGDAETWDDVMSVVDGSDTPVTVWLVEGALYEIPPGSFDVRGLSFEAPRNVNNRAELTLTDGSLLRNPSGVNGGVRCIGKSSSACLAFDGDFGFFRVADIASLENQGTAPMVEILNTTLVLYLELLASLLGVIVNATGGILGVVGVNGVLQIDNGFAVGAAGATLGYVHDGSLFFPTVVGFTEVNIPMGQDGGSGISTFRPIGLFQPVKPGCAYWDTTIGKMIWWDPGLVTWVDAAGAPA